jgi:hypothetical protein
MLKREIEKRREGRRITCAAIAPVESASPHILITLTMAKLNEEV